MSLTLIPQQNFRSMTWKNGGGTTIEMLTSPEGTGFDSFDWRISMARVEQDGPFSTFPAIDRTISVLEGAGLVLEPQQRGAITLTAQTAPFAFPGDLKLHARLIDGPITDLNVMTRRGRTRAFVSKLSAIGTFDLTTDAATTLLLPGSNVTACVGDQHIQAHQGDLIKVHGAGVDFRVTASQNSQAFNLILIELWTI
jgi:environmental stress-induced protein Ves